MKYNAYETVFTPDARLCGSADCLPLDDGNLLCVWEKEKGTSWTIMGSVRNEKGKWSNPADIVPSDRVLRRYPVLYRRKDGSVVLMCRAGNNTDEMHTEQFISEDGGLTFGEVADVVDRKDDVGGPSRGAVLELEDGTLLCGGMTPDGECKAYVYRSENGGADWKRGNAICLPKKYMTDANENIGLWSPSLYSEGGQYVHSIMRSSSGFVFRADSVDGGLTWNTPFPLNVVNSNSPVCAMSDENSKVYLLCNPAKISEGKARGKRTPLALYRSNTCGSTFKKITSIATGYGEFTYPSMKYDDGKLYIVFTKNKTEIILVIIEL